MWVFDGEEWIKEGESNASPAPERWDPSREEVGPSLQILEITPTPRMPEPVLPIPIPVTNPKPR